MHFGAASRAVAEAFVTGQRLDPMGNDGFLTRAERKPELQQADLDLIRAVQQGGSSGDPVDGPGLVPQDRRAGGKGQADGLNPSGQVFSMPSRLMTVAPFCAAAKLTLVARTGCRTAAI